jgi:hypothetical protein
MDKAYKAALIRGSVSSVLLAGVAFFGMAPTQGPELAFYAAGGAFCAGLALRVGEAAVTGDARKGLPSNDPPQ